MKQIYFLLLIIAIMMSSCVSVNSTMSSNYYRNANGHYLKHKSNKQDIVNSVIKGDTESNIVAEGEKVNELEENNTHRPIMKSTGNNPVINIYDEIKDEPNQKLGDNKNIRDKIELEVKKVKKNVERKLTKNLNRIVSAGNIVDDEPQVEGLGIAGFFFSIVGLFIFAGLFGIISVIFGAISLSKIQKNPEKYKGKGFAIVSLLLGVVEVFIFIMLLAAI